MKWQEVIDNPHLQNLPFKIELNEWGNIVMSPASNKHGMLQIALGLQLRQLLPQGKVISECSITTLKGVKVADVAWLSNAFFAQHGFTTPYPQAPEICVEIISPSNSAEEIAEKVALYFRQNTQEVWVCDLDGKLVFYGSQGQLAHSVLAPDVSRTVPL